MDSQFTKIYEGRERNHCWYQARRQIIKSLLDVYSSKLDPSRNFTLLDVGCGSGIDLSLFEKDYSCTGIEPNPFFLNKAQHNCNSPIIQASLPITSQQLTNKYDFILLLDVLEHVEDEQAVLQNISYLLEDHSHLLITVPALPWMWSVHDKINHHYRRYTKESLAQIVNKSRLEIINIKYWAVSALLLTMVERKLIFCKTKPKQYATYIPPSLLNALCKKLLIAEFNSSNIVNWPFGLSLLATIKKKNG